MVILSILLIAVSLSMDAFAISVGAGISSRALNPFYILRASFSFGLFQFAMPIAGWFLGRSFSAYISAFDHWIAFTLLFFIGVKMIREALGNTASGSGICSLSSLFVLSLATSIDALVVGLSFSILGQGIWLRAAIIGLITFILCMVGFEFGKRIGSHLGKWAEIAGGIILIGIACKILIEHLAGR